MKKELEKLYLLRTTYGKKAAEMATMGLKQEEIWYDILLKSINHEITNLKKHLNNKKHGLN